MFETPGALTAAVDLQKVGCNWIWRCPRPLYLKKWMVFTVVNLDTPRFNHSFTCRLGGFKEFFSPPDDEIWLAHVVKQVDQKPPTSYFLRILVVFSAVPLICGWVGGLPRLAPILGETLVFFKDYMTIQKSNQRFMRILSWTNQVFFNDKMSQGFCNVAHDFWVEIPFTRGVVSR